MSDPTRQSIHQIRGAIADGSTTARSVAEAHLERIEAHDPAVHAFNEVLADHALERADAVDAGKVTGPLAGVPIALKDNLCTRVGHTTCSSKMLENFEAPYDATVVEKLAAAGAVFVGKTNLDEFAMGSSTENSAFGATKNPWSTDCVPGGSSGGSAAAVAAGFCAGSLGSDTGGSIRQPAALCGVVGLKPTYGRVSRHGLVAFASSLDQIGPFARSVADAATLFEVIAGHDPLDSTSADPTVAEPVGNLTAGLDEPNQTLRVGVAREFLDEANHPAANQAVRDAVGVFEKAGASIVDVELPLNPYGIPTYYIVATAEASSNLARYDGVHYGHRTPSPHELVELYAASRAEGFGPEVQRRIMLGTYALSSGYYDAYYLRALKVRQLIKHDLDQAFESCDVIIGPTTTGPAFAFGAKSDNPLEMYLNDIYTVTSNLAGNPAISVPCGLVAEEGRRLPIGLQLLGPDFSEASLLRAARIYEAAGIWANEAPTL